MDEPRRLPAHSSYGASHGVSLFERLAEPYLVLDEQLAVVAANGAYRKRFGAAHDLDRHHAQPYDTTHAQERNRLIRALIEDARRGETSVSAVFRFDAVPAFQNAPSGRGNYWRMHASRLLAAHDEPTLFAVRFEEVTAWALANQDGHMMATTTLPFALGQAGLGVWEIDVDRAQVVCSQRCVEHLGADRTGTDSAMNTITADMLLGENIARFAARQRAAARAEPFELERLVTAPDAPDAPDSRNARRWILVRGVGRLDQDGHMRAITGFTLDITARKEREFALDARADNERHARARSDALAATMDQFVTSVSHELRSPLNAIVTWAEVLQRATAPADVARAADAIRRNGRQLSHMVDDLLDSGAITTGKLSVNMAPIDLGALAAGVAEDVRKQAEHKKIELQIGEMSPCIVMGDESRIKQVVWNLLSNAVKFTDAGRVEIALRINDEHAELTVSDTGKGIDTEALPLVFDRFRQIAPRSSGRIGGLGLGLWLVKHIVSLHGGTVRAFSRGAGHGSTFTVRIPRAT